MPASLREAARYLRQAESAALDDHGEDALALTRIAYRVLRAVLGSMPTRRELEDPGAEVAPDVNPHDRNELEEP